MKKLFIPLLILAIAVFSGCVTSAVDDVETIAKTTALAKEFLGQYPNAEVRVTLVSAGFVESDEDFIQNCEGVEVKQYYKVSLSDAATNLNVLTWVDPNSKQVVCSFKKGLPPVTDTDDIFKGEPEFEGDNIYFWVDVGSSMRTTNLTYILQLKEITPTSCASFNVFKEQANGDYKKIGSVAPCEGLLGLLEGEKFVVQISDVDKSAQQALGVSLSGNYVLEDTSVDYLDNFGVVIDLKKDDKIEFKDDAHTYILELFDFFDNTAVIKIYRKSLINGDFQFKSFAWLSGQGGKLSVEHPEVDMTFIWQEVDASQETVAFLQFSKTHPSPDPEDYSGTMVEGANFFVGDGSRFLDDKYVVDFIEIRDDAAIFKVYTKSIRDDTYRFSGMILALNGVISTNEQTPIAIQAVEINFESKTIGSASIVTEKTFTGFPKFRGDGVYTNVKVGDTIETSSGHILKILTIEDTSFNYGRSHIAIYRESFGEKRFGAVILALDGASSSNTLIPSLSVLTSNTSGTTGTIGTIEVTSSTTTCTESWECTEWQPQECPSSGQQTRTCTDKNNCGTTQNKLPETQSCEPGETDDIFKGEPDIEGDNIYFWIDLGSSIRTTNLTYIIQFEEIASSSCASFKVFKKQSNGDYLNIGHVVPCKGLLGLLDGENFVVQISDVDQSNQKALGVSLSGTHILEDTSVDLPDSFGVAINLPKGYKIEFKDGVYTYILELFDFFDNTAVIKIYRKSLATENYEFKSFAWLSGQGGKLSVEHPGVEMTFIWQEVDASQETVAFLQFAKTHPLPDPENYTGNLIEGANFFVGEGSRFSNETYVIDFFEIRDDAAIFKVYTKTPVHDEHRFSGMILALNGVISTNEQTPIAIQAVEINFESKTIGSASIVTEKTFTGIPKFSGDGPHNNVQVGQAIDASNGYILKVATIAADQQSHILVYRESFGEKRFIGIIFALDGVVSSNQLISSLSVTTSDTSTTTGTIGTIEVTSTS